MFSSSPDLKIGKNVVPTFRSARRGRPKGPHYSRFALNPETRDRVCASLFAPRRTSRSSSARDSTGPGRAPARSSPGGSRKCRARPVGRGRQYRPWSRPPSPARTPASSPAESAVAQGVVAATRRHPAALRRRRAWPCGSPLSDASQYRLRFCLVAIESREEVRVPDRQLAVHLQAGVGPAANPFAVMQVRAPGGAVAHVRLVVAPAGADRARPARLAIGLVVDVMLLEKFLLRGAID